MIGFRRVRLQIAKIGISSRCARYPDPGPAQSRVEIVAAVHEDGAGLDLRADLAASVVSRSRSRPSARTGCRSSARPPRSSLTFMIPTTGPETSSSPASNGRPRRGSAARDRRCRRCRPGTGFGSISGLAPAATASAIWPRTVSAKRLEAIGPSVVSLSSGFPSRYCATVATASPRTGRTGSHGRRSARSRNSIVRNSTRRRRRPACRPPRGDRHRPRHSPDPAAELSSPTPVKVPAAARSISCPPRTEPVKLTKPKCRSPISVEVVAWSREDIGEHPSGRWAKACASRRRP